jgi:hypothetical protein
MMANERWEWLLARKREQDSSEGTITLWEDLLVAFECALGSVCANVTLIVPRQGYAAVLSR